MPTFDRVLVDPGATSCAEVLARAVQDADQRARERRLVWPPADLASALAQLAGEACGFRQWEGGSPPRRSGEARTILALAWWSDWLGRKHVRVHASRGRFNNRSRGNVLAPGAERPPLWLVYPDRLYLRLSPQGASWQLHAVCACGASGAPEEIGWMGNECGPCHDRQEAEVPIRQGWAPALLTLAGADAAAEGLAFSPDGRQLLAHSRYQPTVSLWRLDDGASRVLLLEPGWPLSFVFSPAGSLGASGHGGGHVQLWDFRTGAAGAGFRADSRPVRSLAFSPDGRHLAALMSTAITPMTRSAICIWDVEAAREVWRTHEIEGAGKLAFALGGRVLVVGTAGGRVVLVPWADGGPALRPLPPLPGRDLHLAVSREGGLLAVGGIGEEVRVWDLTRGEVAYRLRLPHRPQRQVALSPDGTTLTALADDGPLVLWDLAAQQLLGAYQWHTERMTAVAFSPDGEWLATGGEDRLVKLWPWRALAGRGRSADGSPVA